MATLVDRTVSVVNIARPAIVADKAVSRQMISVGNEITALGRNQIEDIDSRLDAVSRKFCVATEVETAKPVHSISVRVFQQLVIFQNT